MQKWAQAKLEKFRGDRNSLTSNELTQLSGYLNSYVDSTGVIFKDDYLKSLIIKNISTLRTGLENEISKRN